MLAKEKKCLEKIYQKKKIWVEKISAEFFLVKKKISKKKKKLPERKFGHQSLFGQTKIISQKKIRPTNFNKPKTMLPTNLLTTT